MKPNELYVEFIEFCEARDLDFVKSFSILFHQFLKNSHSIKELKQPLRSRIYLDYIRNKPCFLCNSPAPSDPHHQGYRGIGQKTDDTRTVPLCRSCHTKFHSSNIDNKEEIIEDMEREMLKYLTDFLKMRLLGK
jgi:hypothetical protein